MHKLVLVSAAFIVAAGCSSSVAPAAPELAARSTVEGQDAYESPVVEKVTPPSVLVQAVIARVENQTGPAEPRLNTAGNVLLLDGDGVEYELAVDNGPMAMFETVEVSIDDLGGDGALRLKLVDGEDMKAAWATTHGSCVVKSVRCATGDLAFIVDGVVMTTTAATDTMRDGDVVLLAADSQMATRWAAMFQPDA